MADKIWKRLTDVTKARSSGPPSELGQSCTSGATEGPAFFVALEIQKQIEPWLQVIPR